MKEENILVGIIVALGLGLVAIVFAAMTASSNFEYRCVAAGGHTKSLYKTTVCLTPDGRIIEP